MAMWKSSGRIWLALFLALGLALAPALAEARAGNSFGSPATSFGNRGQRYSPAPAMPSPRVTPGLGSGYGGSFFQRHPFLTGLGGGLIGSWLFSHMGWAGTGGYYGHSAFGTILELLIIGGLIWLAWRWFRGRTLYGGGGAGWPAAMMPATAGGGRIGRDINVDDGDLAAFQQLHASIQEAWSAGDLNRLRQMMTPEMLQHFSDELTRNASQGVQNVVSGVQLEKGELTEAWEEGDLQYATALMRWRARDYVVRLDGGAGNTGQIVAGDPRTTVEAEELWTFVRRSGGRWLLSAIQQV
jgi:predicted lipid-binding transport protein (Tim44 family)